MSRDFPVSRRRLLKTVAIGGTAVALSASSKLSPGRFLHGVASGDPLSDRVVIWTRVTTPPRRQSKVCVRWVVAKDFHCREIVGRGRVDAEVESDYAIKLDVTGLEPDCRYFYRFYTANQASPVGRMKTLPMNEVCRYRLGVVSCSNYPAGYFHVYRELAKRNDIDVILHLGDYIYEYPRDGYASDDAAAMGRESIPAEELLTLQEYRLRYAQYRSDPDLQEAHRRHSFICVWDDHEVSNDAWLEGAENHNEGEGDWQARKAAAIQAYYEWLPIREPIDGERERLYRHFQIGDLLDLYMLDTRIIGRDQQLSYTDYMDTQTGAFNAESFQAALVDSNRTLLGLEQRVWLQQQLATSTARWQVLGQQVLMGRMNLPAPLITGQIGFADYATLVQKATIDPASLTVAEQQILAQPSIPYNLDAWDGYFYERELVLETAAAYDSNLVVLAGDTHNAWANNLQTLGGASVGVELATSSVTSPGMEEYFPSEDPDVLAQMVTSLVEPLAYTDLQHRGYLLVTLTPKICHAEWNYVDQVKAGDYKPLTSAHQKLCSHPGANGRVLLDA